MVFKLGQDFTTLNASAGVDANWKYVVAVIWQTNISISVFRTFFSYSEHLALERSCGGLAPHAMVSRLFPLAFSYCCDVP
jgi:hypothetical protein